MSKNEVIISNDVDVRNIIYEIRGQKVMLDSDLAKLYGYEVKRLNEQVQRNIERFPSDFMWQITKDEVELVKSQIVTSRDSEENLVKSQIATSRDNGFFKGQMGGVRKLPYVFTEQGIYALSGVLKGPLATAVSIKLIRAFKELKDFYNSNSYLLVNINDKLIEYQTNTNNRLVEHDNKFNQIFDYIADHKDVSQKIFYKGQIYDAYSLLIDFMSLANKEIILIDNYIDKVTLDILRNKKSNVQVLIYTSNNKLNNTDTSKFNNQYPTLTINKTNKFHDRFLILDKKKIFLIGASIKDAGNKCFGITEMDNSFIKRILNEL